MALPLTSGPLPFSQATSVATQAAPFVPGGMDHNSARLPESIQRKRSIHWRRINISADRPEGVGTVHENVSQTHALWVSRQIEVPLGRRPTISKLGHRMVTQALGGVAHRTVRPEPCSKKVQCQRGVGPLSVLHEVSETSRTDQPSHQDAEDHAVSSSDSVRSANWRRRRATSRPLSTVSTDSSLANPRPCCLGPATRACRSSPTIVRRRPLVGCRRAAPASCQPRGASWRGGGGGEVPAGRSRLPAGADAPGPRRQVRTPGPVVRERRRQQIHLSEDPDHRPASRAHVAVEVEDGLPALVARLEQAGLEHTSFDNGDMHVVFCQDPAGNRWELRGTVPA